MKKVLIIGGGFSGCTSAHLLSLMGGWDVTLVEAQPFLGAGVRTQFYGGHPYTFGPRHFLTQMEPVFKYLNHFLPMRRCNEHQFLTYVSDDQNFYNYPIHRDDFPRMPDLLKIEGELKCLKGVEAAKNLEDYWIGSIGNSLYEKFINGYSKKMWRIEDNSLIDDFKWSPKGVTIKDGPRAAWDTAISAFPISPDGYNPYFDLATKDAKVYLNTAIEASDIPNKTVSIKGNKQKFDIIINTISPDILFGFSEGTLPYVGRDFHKIVLPIEHCFPENVYFLYYAGGEQFTRIVEYKKFYNHKSPTTLLGLEIPSSSGRHYPLPMKKYQDLAKKYFNQMPEGVYSIGRAGSYRYDIDIDDAIAQAMEVADSLKPGFTKSFKF